MVDQHFSLFYSSSTSYITHVTTHNSCLCVWMKFGFVVYLFVCFLSFLICFNIYIILYIHVCISNHIRSISFSLTFYRQFLPLKVLFGCDWLQLCSLCQCKNKNKITILTIYSIFIRGPFTTL